MTTSTRKSNVKKEDPVSTAASMDSQKYSEVVGLDLGYAQCNVTARGWRGSFKSIAKRRSEIVVSGLQDSEGFIVTGENGIWNVGAKGSYDLASSERLVSDIDKAKHLAALGLYSQETGRKIIDIMVSGLPIAEFTDNEKRDNFADKLAGNFHFGFGSAETFIQVNKSIILPQSAGAFFDYVLTEEGSENPDNIGLAAEDLLVLDVGGKTTDGCIMEAGAFSQDSFTLHRGVHMVQKELGRLISKEYGFIVPAYKIDEVLRSKVLKIGGNEEEVSDLCKIAVETSLPEFENELSMWVPDFRRFAAVLLAGGGANVYSDYMASITGIPVVSLPDPEYANANGYRKYGILKVKEGLI